MTTTEVITYGALNNKIKRRHIKTVNLDSVRLTLFKNKNKWNNPEYKFDWVAIPILEYTECIPSILLWGAEYSE